MIAVQLYIWRNLNGPIRQSDADYGLLDRLVLSTKLLLLMGLTCRLMQQAGRLQLTSILGCHGIQTMEIQTDGLY